MTRIRITIIGVIAAAVLVLAVRLGLAAAGGPAPAQGRLVPLVDKVAVTTMGIKTLPDTVYLFHGLAVCSANKPVRILSVKPHRTIGSITVGRFGTWVVPPGTTEATQLIYGGKPQPALPIEYQLNRPLPICEHNADLAFETTRHGTNSAGILSLDVVWADELNGHHKLTISNTHFASCGKPSQSFSVAMGNVCP